MEEGQGRTQVQKTAEQRKIPKNQHPKQTQMEQVQNRRLKIKKGLVGYPRSAQFCSLAVLSNKFGSLSLCACQCFVTTVDFNGLISQPIIGSKLTMTGARS